VRSEEAAKAAAKASLPDAPKVDPTP
jgi:hypothetical protein